MKRVCEVVETLKEFRNVRLGQQIKVYTDHKHNKDKLYSTEFIMQWRLILEECNPDSF